MHTRTRRLKGPSGISREPHYSRFAPCSLLCVRVCIQSPAPLPLSRSCSGLNSSDVPLPSLASLVGPDGTIPRGALAAQLRAALGSGGGGFGHGGSALGLAALQGLSGRDGLGGLGGSDGSLFHAGMGGFSAGNSLRGGNAHDGGGGSDDGSFTSRVPSKVRRTSEMGRGGGKADGVPNAPMLPGSGWQAVVWAHPPYRMVSLTEPWLHALGLAVADVYRTDLTIDAALGSNASLAEEYIGLKSAIARREDVLALPLALSASAGVPGLAFTLNAQPLRDTEGRAACYFLDVTPQPDVAHIALVEGLQASATNRNAESAALPLVAAASQGSPLPRNFLVRKVLEEARGPAGGGGMGVDAEMGVLSEVDPFGESVIMMDVNRSSPIQAGVQDEHEHPSDRRRAPTASVPRRVTNDSMDGGSRCAPQEALHKHAPATPLPPLDDLTAFACVCVCARVQQ